jgi:hypothetical protein
MAVNNHLLKILVNTTGITGCAVHPELIQTQREACGTALQ